LSDQSEQSVEGSEQPTYLDWNNSIGIIDKAFEKGLFVLIIGPKGTGKTSLVREYAIQKSKELDLEYPILKNIITYLYLSALGVIRPIEGVDEL